MLGWDEVAEGVTDIVTGGLDVVDQFVEDKDQANKLKYQLRQTVKKNKHEQIMAYLKGQIGVNRAEAKHKSLFVAGWRPFIGWTCGAGLAYHFIVRDFLVWSWSAMQAAGFVSGTLNAPPELQVGQLVSLVMGMLGLGGWRSLEKLKGKHSDSMKGC